MGLGSYFRTKKPEPSAPASIQAATVKEKNVTVSSESNFRAELRPPAQRFNSSRSSFSNRSTHSSTFLDDIRHEVMVNYLYQQQCSALWVSDGSGSLEGCLLKKSKNLYMACPPGLGETPFGGACAALNVQVSIFRPLLDIILTMTVCNDSELQSHQDIPPIFC